MPADRYVNAVVDLDEACDKFHKLIFELTVMGQEMIGDCSYLILLSGDIFSPNSPINLMDNGNVAPTLTKENPNAEVSFLLGQDIRLPVDILVTFTVKLMPNDLLLQITEVLFTIEPQ